MKERFTTIETEAKGNVSQEGLYIENRREQAEELTKLFQNMEVRPIENNKIVVSAFEGDGHYGCNPRYVVEELHRRDSSLNFVWLMHDVSRDFPDWIEKVEDTPENTAYHLSTAKIWIDNYRKPWGTRKRKGQLYIQTWHGSLGIKAVGRFRGDKLPKIAQIVSEADSELIDYVITDSAYRSRLLPDLLFYTGPVLQVGTPRNDIVITQRDRYHKLIREQYGLPKDVKVILFAPTFRGGNQNLKKEVRQDYPSVDFESLITALGKRFSGQWQVMLRLHPQVAAKMHNMSVQEGSENLCDVSQHDDISELIAGCDAVLTDYSSCAFDAAYAYMPVFLYADDVEEYKENRGKFMWKPGELPFSVAQTNVELQDNIDSFDYDAYCNGLKDFFHKISLIEDGHAAERVADVIFGFMQRND
ncbi:MAG: hypothetical protein E7200_04885 [Selenomonas ruminantium]|nr:hypothetical protein [Selenomonas ruminantium]